MGALGESNSLFYTNEKFIIPGTKYDALKREPHIEELLIHKLEPGYRDVIIIGSDDTDQRIARGFLRQSMWRY